MSEFCPFRDICIVECKTGPKSVAEMPFPCGFEIAGMVKRNAETGEVTVSCPRARRHTKEGE